MNGFTLDDSFILPAPLLGMVCALAIGWRQIAPEVRDTLVMMVQFGLFLDNVEVSPEELGDAMRRMPTTTAEEYLRGERK